MPRLPFASAYLLVLAHLVGLELRGPWVWLGAGYVFVLIPLLDQLVPIPPPDDERAESMPSRSRIHDLLLELWLPTQVVILGWSLWRVTTAPPGWLEWSGLVISAGIVSGAGGITIAHELMHRARPLHRGLAEGLMACTLYAHFCIEHVLGHHKRAATRDDPATARRGEWIYAFLVRVVAASAVHAWQLEGRRARNQGIAWTPKDRRVRFALIQAGLVAAVAWAFGGAGLGFFLAQAAFAVLLLELVDYIEHYGLVRRVLETGKTERVLPHHSWNSGHRVSSAHLFQLTRHSDHHANASRPYYRLRTLPGEAPVMPGGYPAMMLLSLAPPLFFRVVDPLIDDLEAHAAAARSTDAATPAG